LIRQSHLYAVVEIQICGRTEIERQGTYCNTTENISHRFAIVNAAALAWKELDIGRGDRTGCAFDDTGIDQKAPFS
jgi:hypothetical protein